MVLIRLTDYVHHYFPNYYFFGGARLIMMTTNKIPTTRIAPIIIPAQAQLIPSGPVTGLTGLIVLIGFAALVVLMVGLFVFG